MATSILFEAPRTFEAHTVPASRASWCGQLKLGMLGVPVKAYAAIATPPEIPLRQLHAVCGQRIEYRKCCPTHGEVPPEEIVKGYPYQSEEYVRLTEAELASFQPVDEKTLYLEHFLDPANVDLTLLAGRTLFLVPANPAARRPFAMVLQSLRRSSKWAIGRVVLSGKWQIVMIRPVDKMLLVHTLYHPAQRRALGECESEEMEISQQDLRPLLRVIDGADGDIPWSDYQDNAEQRLTKLIEAKLAAERNPHSGRANRRQCSGGGPLNGHDNHVAAYQSRARRAKAA